jgi:predicted thioesterase
MSFNVDALAGLELTEQFVVTSEDLAVALGSGEVEVLATPRVIAWMEQVTVRILSGYIPTDSTSVGIHVDVVHRAPSIVGDAVLILARVNNVSGSKVIFDLVATHDESVIASGTITRAVVVRQEFTKRAGLN